MRVLRFLTGLAALISIAVALNLLILKEDMSTATVLAPLGLGFFLGLVWIALRVLTVTEAAGKGRSLHGLNSAVAGAAVFGICVVLYAFASHWNREWDLTQEGRRELAPQTKQVLQGLNDEVKVVAFFVDANDSFIDASRDKTMRFLRQAQSYSPRLLVEMVDPVANPARLAEFKLEKERLSPQGTVVIKSGMRQKVLPLSGVTARLEERDFTNALINVVRKSQPKVYFLQGHGERNPEQATQEEVQASATRGARTLKARLEAEGYQTDVLTLSLMNPELPKDADVILINGPLLPFRPQEISLFQEYLDGGGRMFMLLDPLMVPLSLVPSWLQERYGIVVGNDILFSGLMPDAPTSVFLLPDVGKITSQLTSRTWPDDFPGCFNQRHPITRGFDQEMRLEGSRSVGLVRKLPEKVAGLEILRSLPFTYAEDDLELLREGKYNREPDEPEDAWPVAVAVAAKTDTPAGDSGRVKEARLVVVGNGYIASNEGLQYLGHINFVLNCMAWLTETEELIAIRPTGKEDPPILLTSGEEQTIAWISTLGLVQAIALAGIGVHLLRRKYQ
jgi:hypothetical protein